MGSSWAGDRTCVLCISRQILNPWTSRDVLGKNHSVTIFYLLSAGRITLSLSVILVFRAVFGDSINMSALQMETLRFRVAKSFFSYKRTGGMCGQQLNPELDGSEEANAERGLILCDLVCAELVAGPCGGVGSACAPPSVVMENSSPSPPSSEMQHSVVRQASTSLFLLRCESLFSPSSNPSPAPLMGGP